MRKGFFITFEGVDGTGKSTQIKLLEEELSKKGFNLYVTKEPGDTVSGSRIGPGIRPILFGSPGTKNMSVGVADLLFMADHLQNTYDIKNALSQGKVVISDRYADSQFAYSATPSRKAADWANKLYREQYGPVPDLTLLFVVRGPSRVISGDGNNSSNSLSYGAEDISWALNRANARRGVEAGKQEGKSWNDTEEQRKVQNEYLKLIGMEPRTHLIAIWEDNSILEIFAKVNDVVMNELWEAGLSNGSTAVGNFNGA